MAQCDSLERGSHRWVFSALAFASLVLRCTFKVDAKDEGERGSFKWAHP